jgi:inositol transport system substrate-binding protein
MKRLLAATALSALCVGTANAENVGISIQNTNELFQTLLVRGIQAAADSMDDVDVQFEDAQRDVAKQLDQVNNFIASGVDAIIVTLVDTTAAPSLSAAAEAAGIPLVFVNLQPINVDELPDNQAYVGSNEIESGTLQAFEVCKLLRAQGKSEGANAYIIVGSLSHQAALQRTKDVDQVLATDMCSFIKVTDRQESQWARDTAQNLMTNWLSSGEVPDAVFANNDESAIGAILALKASGIEMKDVVVGGIDATQDALQAMQAGDLDVTVFQDAVGQGTGALEAGLKLAKGEAVDQKVYIPFQLVTPANINDFLAKN